MLFMNKICISCNNDKKHHAKGLCKSCYKNKLQKTRQYKSDLKLCECGCGELISSKKIDGVIMRFKLNHNLKLDKSGSNHPMWKGGITYRKDGYVLIHKPDHPNAYHDGYVLEHRYVMEMSLGRYLRMDEVVHHLDNNPVNNKIENLKLLTQSEHMKLYHNKKLDMSDRFCCICKSKKTYKDKKGYEHWSIYNDEYICQKCNWKLYYNKKRAGSVLK